MATTVSRPASQDWALVTGDSTGRRRTARPGFVCADMLDIKVGTMKKQDAAEVAQSMTNVLLDSHAGRDAREAGGAGHGRTA